MGRALKNRCAAMAVVLLLVTTFSISAQTPLNVRFGHLGPVTSLVVDMDQELLFSGGQDGKILVWRTEDERLVQVLKVDRLPITRLVLYPDGEHLAVVSSDGDTHRLSTWHWPSGQRKFVRILEDEVFHVEISPQSSYLIYTVPSLESVKMLTADTGRELPFMRQSTGIVTWAVVSNSEERILTYVPATGSLTYRRIVTGRIVTEFQGPKNLDRIVLDGSRRYIAARSPQGRVVVVDLLSGEEVAQANVSGVRDIVRDPTSNEFIVLVETIDGRYDWRRYQFDQESRRLRLRYDTPRIVPATVGPFVPVDREFFAGTHDGHILRWLPFRRMSEQFTQSRIEPAIDFAVDSARMYVMTTDSVLTISTDFLRREPARYRETAYIRDRSKTIETTVNSQLLQDPDGDLYLYSPDGDQQLREYQTYGTSPPLPFDLPGPLQSLKIRDDVFVLLSRSQGVILIDRETGERTFQYRAIGAQDMVLTDVGLFIGKAAQGVLDSALLRVQPETGETVPIDTQADLVFELVYDERRGRLFTIGIRTDSRTGPETILELHQGYGLQQHSVLTTVQGEHLSAAFALDRQTGDLFTTLDARGGIVRWDGNQLSEIRRNPAHVPKILEVSGPYLVSQNDDGTISLFDKTSSTPVLDLYLVRRYSSVTRWIAISSHGYFFTPYDDIISEEYLSTPDANSDLADRRLKIR